MEKNPREIIAPEVQKELLVLEEQEVWKQSLRMKDYELITNVDFHYF